MHSSHNLCILDECTPPGQTCSVVHRLASEPAQLANQMSAPSSPRGAKLGGQAERSTPSVKRPADGAAACPLPSADA